MAPHVVQQARLVREHLGAELTDERLLAGVDANVLFEIRAQSEALLAVRADAVRPRGRVHAQVPVEGCDVRELLATLGTDNGLKDGSGGVPGLMPLPRVTVREGPGTVLALERLLARVRPQVNAERHLLGESPVAVVAAVRLHARVRDVVFAQVVATREALAAVFALERPLTGVRPRVFLQQGFLAEPSRAVFAYETTVAVCRVDAGAGAAAAGVWCRGST